jgi:hypothetical protein
MKDLIIGYLNEDDSTVKKEDLLVESDGMDNLVKAFNALLEANKWI